MHEHDWGLCAVRSEQPNPREERPTVQARPSTVASLKGWPTVKEMLVVRTLVEVLMHSSSPCWLISTTGLEAAATAIFLKNTLTPDPAQTELSLGLHQKVTFDLGDSFGRVFFFFFFLSQAKKATGAESWASRNFLFFSTSSWCRWASTCCAAVSSYSLQLFVVLGIFVV